MYGLSKMTILDPLRFSRDFNGFGVETVPRIISANHYYMKSKREVFAMGTPLEPPNTGFS